MRKAIQWLLLVALACAGGGTEAFAQVRLSTLPRITSTNGLADSSLFLCNDSTNTRTSACTFFSMRRRLTFSKWDSLKLKRIAPDTFVGSPKWLSTQTFAAIVATTSTFSGLVTANAGIQLATNVAAPTGGFGKSATQGLVIAGVAGSANDLILTNGTGQTVLAIPTGSQSTVFSGGLTSTAVTVNVGSGPSVISMGGITTAYVIQSLSGVNKWAFGPNVNTGSNAWDLYNYTAAASAISVNATTSVVSFGASLTVATGVAITSGGLSVTAGGLAVSSGTTSVQALTATSATFSGSVQGSSGANGFGWVSSTQITSASDGILRISNAAGNDFTRLQFGGTTLGDE